MPDQFNTIEVTQNVYFNRFQNRNTEGTDEPCILNIVQGATSHFSINITSFLFIICANKATRPASKNR